MPLAWAWFYVCTIFVILTTFRPLFYDGVSLFCAIFKFLYIVEDALLLAAESVGALVLFLIPLALSKMHYYWLLKVGALLLPRNS